MIEDLIQQKQNLINKYLKTLLKPDYREHQILFDSMNYSLMAGGKRIRPFLFLFLLDILGNDSKKYLDIAAAIECIHTYSLIHDDLPAMDNDDYRRGKPTNHKKFGSGIATMAGDGLLTVAFTLIVDNRTLTAEEKIKLIHILSVAAGPFGMVAGQAHDKSVEGQEIDLKELQLIDYCKTGCLLCAPIDMAMAISKVSEEEKDALHEFGKHLGLLFQITDDLLDVAGDLSVMGKMPGQDVTDKKITYVTMLGIYETKYFAQQEIKVAKKVIENIKYNQILSKLLDFIYKRIK